MAKWSIVTLAIALLISGCISSEALRDRRIVENQALFDNYPAEIQEQIRSGQINIGFSKEMVKMAWGKPSKRLSRTTAEGSTIIWQYSRTRYHPYSRHMSVPVAYVDRNGRQRIRYHSVWVDHHTREEYAVAKVEFKDDKVTTIEQLQ